MARHRVRFASFAIALGLAIAGFDMATGLEHWPFGSYPMYSTLYSRQLSWMRLYGVTDRGEIPLRGARDFAPFDEARLVMALQRLRGMGDDRKLDQALRNLMGLYNHGSAQRSPASQPIRALRLYTVQWALRPGLGGSEAPDERTLIAQVNVDEAPR